ncbi:MAG: hypothetical protein ABF593_04565 [Acetobacter papayae]|uniref:hypothetical protein n=1 Tax=Acetobacter papayae TaxID=1076592 RepID=UPI0039EC0F98
MTTTKKWWADSFPSQYYAFATDSTLGGYPIAGLANLDIYSSEPSWLTSSSSVVALTEDEWLSISPVNLIIKDGTVVSYTPSSVVTLSGASTATAGTALTLTVGLNGTGPASAVTVNLSDGSASGKFSSDALTFAEAGAATQTVTYTSAAAGTVTISGTNTGGLTNPADLSVTVAAA